MRALLVALVDWVESDILPPDSRFPSRADGTLAPLAEAHETFPRLPQVNFPKVLNELRLRDHSVEPPIESTPYPVFVQSTDADGNALGGIRHPLITAPCALLGKPFHRADCPRDFAVGPNLPTRSPERRSLVLFPCRSGVHWTLRWRGLDSNF